MNNPFVRRDIELACAALNEAVVTYDNVQPNVRECREKLLEAQRLSKAALQIYILATRHGS